MKLHFVPRLTRLQRSLRPKYFRVAVMLSLSLVLAAALPRFSTATRQSTPEANTYSKNQTLDAVPGEILVRFRTRAAAKDGLVQQFAVLKGRQIPFRLERLGKTEVVEGLRLARVAPEDTADAISALAARPDVIYAEPNYVLRPSALPNDPQFPDMPNLRNTGQSGGTPGNDIGAEQAWNTTTGSDTVVIGVVDSGIDIEHPDLQANIWRNTGEVADNGIDDDGDGYVDDVNGWDFYNNDKTVFDSPTIDDHGTHVAGTIGAVGNNGVGVVGVSWRVKLMPLKFLGSPAGTGTTAQAIAALQYAKAMHDRGVNIRAVNNSWGGRNFSQALLDVVGELNSAGILFVAAAGNEGMDNDSFPTYPANFDVPNVISVGAEDGRYQRATFSNFGTETVDVYAPGVGVLSTLPGGGYTRRDGTSMAAPHVTGAAALVCAARPGISLSQLRNSILFGSSISSERPAGGLVTTTRLKASGAVQSAIENDSVPPGSAADFRISFRSGRRIDLSWIAAGDDGAGGGRAALYKISFVDATTAEEIPLLALQPAAPGSPQTEAVYIPFRHVAGQLKIVTFDNAGNQGAAATVDVSVNAIVTTPYIQTTSAAISLSTGGVQPVGLKGDDLIRQNLSLPIPFRFFGQPAPGVSVSTNGALYITTPPAGTDAFNTLGGLRNHVMIAGLWDDLRTDRRPDDGVYMVTPDPDRVIFRWQAVTFDSPLPGGGTRGEHPVSFEIELQRSGHIIIRYGEGNTNVQPIVGVSGGDREAYFVGSHSSESGLISLTNSPSIIFSPAPCSWSLNSTAQTVSSDHYSGVVSVDTGGSCQWTAISNVSWISISHGANSIGSGIAEYNVIANQGTASRSGTITVAGQTFTVNQAGATCTYQVGTTVQGFPAAGGQSGTSVITQSDCPWTATTTASWISFLTSPSGFGNGGIQFLIAPNSGSARTGTISVGNQTVTINQGGTANPIDSTQKFVTQHYLDFLNRQPDAAGLTFWMNNIDSCGDDVACREVKRIDTSAAYFLSIEFQQTGYLVHRLYKTTFGRRPLFAEFLADTQTIGAGVIVNSPGWQDRLEQNKREFIDAWMTRTAFTSIYNGSSNAQFVDTLIGNTGATFTASDRDSLADVLNTQVMTRTQVFRLIAENEVFYYSEYNAAFVEMQYFGYLRRNPQDAPDNNLDGYNFWLSKLNQFGGDFRRAEMVKAFLVSGEYRQRFAP